MKAYRIFVFDRRLAEPIRLAAELRHDARAREFARERLASSAHYDAIEVWEGGSQLLRLERAAAATAEAA